MAVDVFAGGGGLTVGLKRAGFKVVSAIEIDDHAFATYKANHPEVQAFKRDVRTVKGRFLRKLSPTGIVDLVAGCPPCQGFCSLTSKYRREDHRNELVLEMARLIREIRPNAVMMENVPGLMQRGKDLFKAFVDTLQSLGYIVECDVLQVADYGIPQNRRRLVLLAGKGFHIPLPSPTHSRNGEGRLKPWSTLRHAISKMPRQPVTLDTAHTKGGPQMFNWHVVRNMAPQNVQRLKKTKPGSSRICLPDSLRPACHKDREVGFSNVYGRASWDQVSPTITGGCTTFSKGRFGHPIENRTFSVREAALIQTFPKEYIFDTPYMEHVCNIVGNALPCDFAEVLARQCIKTMKKQKTYSKS
jgi:DNA (cytosine-5)-methyltransferase 1